VNTLQVSEIFLGILGENITAGKPAVFVRLGPGKNLTVEEALSEIEKFEVRAVCVIENDTPRQSELSQLLTRLLDEGYSPVVLETESVLLDGIPPSVIKLLDVACPELNSEWAPPPVLPHDQIRFSITSKEDFDWAQKMCEIHVLTERCTVLFIPAYGKVNPTQLTEWIHDNS